MKLNEIICGDCLEILSDIPNESIDFILTDPPYFIIEEVSVIRRGNKMKYKETDFEKETGWDRQWKNKEEYFVWLKKVLGEMVRVLKDDHHIVMFCDKRDLSYLANFGEELGCQFRPTLFWRKVNPVPQARQISPMKSIEVACWLTKGKVKRDFYNWQLGMVSDVIEAPIPQKEGASKRHPTQKSLKVGLWMVSRFSKPGDIVLDPFAGAGTFSLASKTLNRKFIGIEGDEDYVKVAQDRLVNGEEYAMKKVDGLYEELVARKPQTVSMEEFNNLFFGESKVDIWDF